MNIAEPTLYSFTRATAVALATLVLILVGGNSVRSAPRSNRRVVFWLAMLALFTPGFILAYATFPSASRFDALSREVLYSVLTFVRYGSIALLTVWLMPSSFTVEAMHCFRQDASPSWLKRCIWELREWGRGIWIGVTLVFLLAFQEFDFATTWNMKAWSVRLFDAQAGGFALSESMKLALLPFGIQAALILLLGIAVLSPSRFEEHERPTGRTGIATIVFAVANLVPLCVILIGAFRIRMAGLDAFTLVPWREVANALGLSLAGTVFAWLAAGWVAERRGWRLSIVLPGLFGPLICGLAILAVLRLPMLDRLRDTLIPTIFALVLLLIPFAVLLRIGIETTRDKSALHIARASGSRFAMWPLNGFPQLCALLLLFCFCFGDFTINSLLAPPAFTSATLRLLNLFHYGQSAALGLMVVLSFAIPLAAALLTATLARFYARRRVH